MDRLYVCLFSDGAIKVGRSNDPENRIRQHEARVACLGVDLQASFTVECAGSPFKAEAALIEQCVVAASTRHRNEWFRGLVYADVCRWAADCAATAPAPHVDIHIADECPDFRNVLRVLRLAGYTQADLARLCGCSQAAISDLSTGVTKDPVWSTGNALVELAKQVQSGISNVNPTPASTSGTLNFQGA